MESHNSGEMLKIKGVDEPVLHCASWRYGHRVSLSGQALQRMSSASVASFEEISHSPVTHDTCSIPQIASNGAASRREYRREAALSAHWRMLALRLNRAE